LGERRWRGTVENAYAAPRPGRYLDAIEPGTLVLATGADRPHLAGRQRVAPDVVLALELRRDDELLHAVVAERVAELSVAELGRADALLLLLHASPNLQGQANGPLQVF